MRTIVVLLMCACTDAAPPAQPPTPDEYITDCETAGDSGATVTSDETYTAFINAEAANRVVVDCGRAPRMIAPVGTLSATTPPAFSFSPTNATCARKQAPLWKRLVQAFVLEGNAYAHCGAISGENYLLRLSHPGESKPVYMAMLSVTTFTPDAAIWSRKLAGRAGQTLVLTVERASFLMGDITQGPYVQPAPISFTVTP